jgi:GTP:adenosylcobinamide-phosphate guanylyltransferase
MAEGKDTRFGKDIEKTMIELLGKSLIKRVIESAKTPKRISETCVAVTSYNSQAAITAKASTKVIEKEGQR